MKPYLKFAFAGILTGGLLLFANTAVAQPSEDGPLVAVECRAAMLKERAKAIGQGAAAALSAQTGTVYKFKKSAHELLAPRPVARIPLARLIGEQMTVVSANPPVIDLPSIPTIDACRLSVRFYYTLKANGTKVRGSQDLEVDGSLVPSKNHD